jgi:signal transduction histidine kinase
LLRVALEQAGAARALLVLPVGGGWRCVARASVGAGALQVEARDLPLAQAGLPESLLHFVLRTRETVLLDDALASAQFRDDPFVQRTRPRSVLCMPLLRQGKLNGVLYLENALAPGLFTPVRVLVLELIAAQAAISLDHAELMCALRDENAAQRHALESSRRKSAFLAGLNAQIRTPMGAIACVSSLALRTNLDDEQRAYVEQILRASQALMQIVNDILDFARIEAGTMVLESVAFALPELMADIHAQATGKAAAHGLQLQLELDPQLPHYLSGDPLRLGQVLGNLLNHALQDAGARAQVTLAVRLMGRDGDVAGLHFSVRDDGLGLGEDGGAALFHPFRHGTRRAAGSGSGLGMAIAQELVQRMGGLIELHNLAAGGTEFSFRIDLACVAAAAPAAPDAPGPSADQRAQLARLAGLLDAFSGEAGEYFESIRPALATLVEPHALARLAAHIAGYQFEDARRLLDAQS